MTNSSKKVVYGNTPEDRIRRYISYDLGTGEFTRIASYWDRHVGTRADHVDRKGFMFVGFEGRRFLGHRLAWWFGRSEWPALDIIHQNGDTTDNRLENLLVATPKQRIATRSNYGPLKKGVTLHKKTGRFQAQIRRDGQKAYLGLYETEDEAHAAYLSELRKTHPMFARAA